MHPITALRLPRRMSMLLAGVLALGLVVMAIAAGAAGAAPPRDPDPGGGGGSTGGGGTPAPALTTVSASKTDSGPPTGFKTCHGMSTNATLFKELNRVTATTDIWSHCWFGGFTGSAMVLLEDAAGHVIGSTDPANATWGVNGQFEALFDTPSDRHEVWGQVVDPSIAAHTAKIDIVHSHAGRNRLLDIVNQAVAYGKPIGEVIALIAALV